MIEDVQAEKKKTQAMSEKMQKKIADCTAEVMKLKTEIIKLNADIETYFTEISAWMASEKVRADAKFKMSVYKNKSTSSRLSSMIKVTDR